MSPLIKVKAGSTGQRKLRKTAEDGRNLVSNIDRQTVTDKVEKVLCWQVTNHVSFSFVGGAIENIMTLLILFGSRLEFHLVGQTGCCGQPNVIISTGQPRTCR